MSFLITHWRHFVVNTRISIVVFAVIALSLTTNLLASESGQTAVSTVTALHLLFDNDANDSAGSNHGTLTGTPSFNNDEGKNVISLDGIDDKVAVPDSELLHLSKDFTVSFFMKKTAEASSWSRIVGKGDSSNRNFDILEEYKEGKRLLFLLFCDDGSVMSLYSKTGLEVGQFYHVVAKVKNKVASLYINGKLDSSKTFTGTPRTSSAPLTIGYAGFYDHFPGELADLRIYRNSISIMGIAQLGSAIGVDMPEDPDFDDDSVTNVKEAIVGSNPLESNSDGDGFSDGEEILLYGTDPTDANNSPDNLAKGWLSTNWKTVDIGQNNDNTLFLPGSMTHNESTGIYSIAGSGQNLSNTRHDEAFFYYKALPSKLDIDFCFKVTELGAIHFEGGVGLMIRDSLDANAKSMAIVQRSSGRATRYLRLTTDSLSKWDYESSELMNLPSWIRLNKVGDIFKVYTSLDGDNWHLLDTQTISMSGSIYFGMCLNCGDRTRLSHAKVSNFKCYTPADQDNDGILDMDEERYYGTSATSADSDGDKVSDFEEVFTHNTNPLSVDSDEDGINDNTEIINNTDPNVKNGIAEIGWQTRNIGDESKGSTIYTPKKTWKLRSQSTDIWDYADSFHLCYKTLSEAATKDYQVITKVDRISDTSSWAKAGVMFRLTEAADSPNVLLFRSPRKGIGMQIRYKYGEYTKTWWSNYNDIDDVAKDTWLRLVKQKDKFTSFYSIDKIRWHKIGTATVDAFRDQTVQVGLALTSHDNTQMTEAIFSEVSVDELTDFENDGIDTFSEDNDYNTSDSVADTDKDGITDIDEVSQGTHPLFPATSFGGKVLHKRGMIARYYKGDFNYIPDFSKMMPYKLGTVDIPYFNRGESYVLDSEQSDYVAAQFDSYIHVPEDGSYMFYLSSNDGSRFYVDGNLMIANDGVHKAKEKSAVMTLTTGFHAIRIDYFEKEGAANMKLSWSSSLFSKQLVSPSVLIHAQSDYNAFAATLDDDGDGLNNKLEEQIGSDKGSTDSDGDGLTDYEEYKAGLSPKSVDTDGNGLSDYFELKEAQTGGTQNLFDGTVEDIIVANGSEANFQKGLWFKQDDTVYSQSLNGSIEFTVNVAEANVYLIRLIGSEHEKKAFNMKLDFYIDGQFIGHKILPCVEELNSVAGILSPWLNIGAHKIEVFWENAQDEVSLEVKQVKLQKLGGPDANSNGVLDWVEKRLSSQCSLPKLIKSKVSPACIEGKSTYINLLEFTGGAVQAGVKGEWYSNVDLNSSQSTTISASFQHGIETAVNEVHWDPTDILTQDEITIRKGDELLLTAGQFVNGAQVSVNNEDISVPKKVSFADAGTYQIEGKNRSLGKTTSGTLTVHVIEAPGNKFKACQVGVRRTVELKVPAGLYLEADSRLERFTLSTDQSGLSDDTQRYDVVIDDNKERYLLLRIGKSGPIVERIVLKGFLFYGSGQSIREITAVGTDGTVEIEVGFMCSPVIKGLEFRSFIFLSGVVFDNGTTNLTTGDDDFDESGLTIVHFIKTPESWKTATCHHVDIYQDGKKIGKAY